MSKTAWKRSALGGLVASTALAVLACGGGNGGAAPPVAASDSARDPAAPPRAATAKAPATTPASGTPLVLAPMQLTMAQMRGAIELKQDGTVVVEGHPVAKIVGADFVDGEGKVVLSVLPDGTLRMDGSGKSARFDATDAVVIDDGSKLVVGDDGAVLLFNRDGKVDPMSGKMKLVGFTPAARRAGSVLVMAFFLLQDRAAGAAPPPAAGPAAH